MGATRAWVDSWATEARRAMWSRAGPRWSSCSGGSPAQLCRGGRLVAGDVIAVSSGSTGEVCFPLGTWVGGLYTLSCVRQLAARGYPITAVAPGNNKAEILRVIPELGRHVDQVVLLGYPPFVKDVIDSGLVAGVDWPRHSIKLVLAARCSARNGAIWSAYAPV